MSSSKHAQKRSFFRFRKPTEISPGVRNVKILYPHGFEESQSSPKPVLIKNQVDFQVYHPELEVYLTRKNGFVKHLLKNKRILSIIALSGLSVYFGLPVLVPLVGSALGLFYFRKHIKSEVVQGSLQDTYAVAVNALEYYEPDVVVGFSWGGALATMLLKSGRWEGPTVLLAPAYETLIDIATYASETQSVVLLGDEFATKEDIVLSDKNLKDRIKVVVGTKEQILPLEGVKHFAKRNGFELILVEDAVHKLWKFVELPSLIRSIL